MKLSEAIREGAKLRPMGYVSYFPMNNKGELCSCAFGAAYEALMANTDYVYFNKLEAMVGVDTVEAQLKSPLNDGVYSLFTVVTDMNDSHKYTREEIADYIEQFGY